MVSDDFLKRFNQTKFMVAAFEAGSIFLLPHTHYKINGTPSEAMEYIKSRDYDCSQLFWQVGSNIGDVLVVASYNKNKSDDWVFSDKAEGYLLRIEDWRKELDKKRIALIEASEP